MKAGESFEFRIGRVPNEGHVWLVQRFGQVASEVGVRDAAQGFKAIGMPLDVALMVCRDAVRGRTLKSAYSCHGDEVAHTDWGIAMSEIERQEFINAVMRHMRIWINRSVGQSNRHYRGRSM